MTTLLITTLAANPGDIRVLEYVTKGGFVGYILVDRYRPFRFDMTAAGLYGLSPRTLDILKDLEGGVTVTYFELPPSEVMEADVINTRVLDLLEEYKVRSGGKITYEIANPLREPLLGNIIWAATGQGAFFNGWWWWPIEPSVGMILILGSLALINMGLDELANPRVRKTE